MARRRVGCVASPTAARVRICCERIEHVQLHAPDWTLYRWSSIHDKKSSDCGGHNSVHLTVACTEPRWYWRAECWSVEPGGQWRRSTTGLDSLNHSACGHPHTVHLATQNWCTGDYCLATFRQRAYWFRRRELEARFCIFQWIIVRLLPQHCSQLCM